MRVPAFPAQVPRRFRASRVLVLAAVAALLAAFGSVPPLGAQTAPALEAIGTLVGDDVAVKGAVSFDAQNGRSSALLSSGSEITVRSGKARIDLDPGDTIAVCGPAHFSILKAGGAITIALDYGQVHPQLNSAVALTIYTPLIVATPLAVGDGPRDLTIGLDQAGSMCVTTERGALRLQEQLTGQGMLVPQGGQMNFSGSQLNAVRAASESCSCELLVVQNTVKKRFEMNLSLPAPAPQPAKQPAESVPAPPAPAEEPIYRISVPLTFDAASPEPPPGPDPQTIILVREARVEPEVIFQGHVEAAPEPSPAAATSQASGASGNKTAPKKPGLLARFFGIFRRRHSISCAGAGCATTT